MKLAAVCTRLYNGSWCRCKASLHAACNSRKVATLDDAVHMQLSLAAEVVIKACILVSRLDILWDDVFPRFQVMPASPWLGMCIAGPPWKNLSSIDAGPSTSVCIAAGV